MAPLLSVRFYILPAVLLLSSAVAPRYTAVKDTNTLLQMDAHYTMQRRVKRFLANSTNDATNGPLKEMLKQKLHLLLRQITIPDNVAPSTPIEELLPEKESRETREADVITGRESTPSPRDNEQDYRSKERGYEKTVHIQQHTHLKPVEYKLQPSEICYLKQLKKKLPESDSATVLVQLLLRELKIDLTKYNYLCDENIEHITAQRQRDHLQGAIIEARQKDVIQNSNLNKEGSMRKHLRIQLVINLPLDEILATVHQSKSKNHLIHPTHHKEGFFTSSTIAPLKSEISSGQETKLNLANGKDLNTDQFHIDMKIVDSNKLNMTVPSQTKINEIEQLLKLYYASRNKGGTKSEEIGKRVKQTEVKNTNEK